MLYAEDSVAMQAAYPHTICVDHKSHESQPRTPAPENKALVNILCRRCKCMHIHARFAGHPTLCCRAIEYK
jgi:hypothetical protein